MVDGTGERHLPVVCGQLGLRRATENAASCKALLVDLIERGLPTDNTLLVVIDCAKALHRHCSLYVPGSIRTILEPNRGLGSLPN
jgi:hypothetical protein